MTWQPRYVQWTIPTLLYQTRRNNPLVYKGLKLERISRNNIFIILLNKVIQMHDNAQADLLFCINWWHKQDSCD